MEINKIYNIDFLDNNLPDKCANLLIVDPPYFEIKGNFDFIWDSFDEYLKDVEKWSKECKRILKDNGSLFWYGHASNIAYSQIILDKHFTFINSLVWDKKDAQTKKNRKEDCRSFIPVTERILFYGSSSQDKTGLYSVCNNVDNFKGLRNYFERLYKHIGRSKKSLLDEFGQGVDHCFRFSSSQWSLPTLETYNKLIVSLDLRNWSGFREYESQREEYERQRRPFNNFLKLTDVLSFYQEAHITKKYDHPTQKPETLTRALILTTTREKDIIIVPFAGSGTECAMSVKEKRNFVGFEKDKKHFETASKRIKQQTSQLTMF